MENKNKAIIFLIIAIIILLIILGIKVLNVNNSQVNYTNTTKNMVEENSQVVDSNITNTTSFNKVITIAFYIVDALIVTAILRKYLESIGFKYTLIGLTVYKIIVTVIFTGLLSYGIIYILMAPLIILLYYTILIIVTDKFLSILNPVLHYIIVLILNISLYRIVGYFITILLVSFVNAIL